MKKTIPFLRFLLILFVVNFKTSFSFGQSEMEFVKTYLEANRVQNNLSQRDISEMTISSQYLSPSTGWYHVYFNQNYKEIDVYNGLLNATIANGKVFYVGNSFIKNIEALIPANSVNSQITPLDALIRAASSVGLISGKSSSIKEVSSVKLSNGQTSKSVYNDLEISNENIPVKLFWYLHNKPKDGEEKAETKVLLAWNVVISTKDHKNIWEVQVDAATGNILQTTDQVIHCNFGTPDHTQAPHICSESPQQIKSMGSKLLQPFAPNSYNVFDYPLESPNHGSRTIVTNPFTKFVATGTGPGATNGWHHDGTTSYTTTRGNNVYAKEDLAADNETTIGASPISATLDFNYPYSQAINTAAANRDAATTNLFYWNNLIHDVLWKYGFDEPSGNFQKDNMGRGGNGNDFVFADVQDGSGTNNANFSTPVDGGNGRMQMFIFSNGGSPQYQPDSDFDNGVITHEYGHGWSIRLTGGPANSSCLGNQEQGGEGWSDYLGLMLTTNWASLTPTTTSANIPKGIGTYVLGQTTTGAGIRPFRYSYDMANINPTVTYGQVGSTSFSIPHGIGSIWATMLWDMTWEIIFQDNQIVSNIYNTTNLVGNVAALKLVNEGLRLQPCSPSFVDARDAILAADQALFNGKYRCSIGRAFARRGLGLNASTGASSNDRIVTEDFTPFPSRVLTSAKTASVCSGSVFNYTATTSASGTTTYSWTRPAVVGISNAASSGNGAILSETLINTTSQPIVVTYNFSLTPDACSNTPTLQPVKVTVNPSPIPTVANYSVCQNGSVPSGQGLVVTASISNIFNGVLTTSSPTYRRGTGNNTTTYTPSGVGTSVYYQTFTFVSPVTGSVSIETVDGTLSPADSPYDTYLTLYQTSFNPTSPATNFLRGDDDSGTLQYSSKLTHSLLAGTTYVLVISTYANNTTGTYKLQSTANIFGGTNSWFVNASGGSALATGDIFNPVGVAGSGITNTATPINKNYYVESSGSPGCRTLTTFRVSAPTVGGNVLSNANICSNTNTGTLTVSGHTGSIVRWESSTNNFTTASTIANTTTSYPYNNLTQTIKFRAVVKNGACATVNSNAATITKIASPTGVSVNKTSICSGTSVTLTAACASGTVTWYNQATGGTAIGTGNTLTQSPTTTTTYHAACVNVCSTVRVATSQVVVTPVSRNITTNITSGNTVNAATQTITATNKVISPAKTEYRAGKSISLNAGFEARSGAVFKAEIKTCTN